MASRGDVLRQAGKWALSKHLPLDTVASLLDEIDRALEWDFEQRDKYGEIDIPAPPEPIREWGLAERPFVR